MKELAAAIEAALVGGDVLESYFGGDFEVGYKGESNLVTQADTDSERRVLEVLRQRVRDASFLAEETGEAPAESGESTRRFIIDPLDGTTNFAHAYPFFAVSIGFEEEGQMMAGVVYDPVRKELFTAERGGGAFLNGRRLRVSETRRMEEALLVTGFPYDLKDDLEGNLRLFTRFMGVVRAIRRDGAAALDLCYLAAGRFDGFWEEKLAPWDTAAGALIVEEAGGRVSDFEDMSFHCSGKQILATNRHLQQPMLDVIRGV